MQTRHKVPIIFTLYMVDVLCCALGCVILLWFLKVHEAKGQMREAQLTNNRLARTQEQLHGATGEVADVRVRLQGVEKDRDQVRRQRDEARQERDAVGKERDEVR